MLAGRATSPRLVGRVAELAALRAALDSATGGRTSTVLVEGPAGAGKSRLVAEFAREATRSDGIVVAGACVDLGGAAMPYAPVADVVRGLQRHLGLETLVDLAGPWAADLAVLLPDLDPSPSPQRQPRAAPAAGHGRLLTGLRHLLERCGELAPLVVVIEDLHWSDAATRDVVTYIARTLDDARVLAIATVRLEAVPSGGSLQLMLGELRVAPGVVHLDLPALSAVEVREQIEAILGRAPSEEVVGRIVPRAGGNPFFVEELLASSDARDVLPAALRDVLLRRLEPLSEEARSIVGAVAVVGRRVDELVLAALAGLDDESFSVAVREAIDSGVLVKDAGGEGYVIRHALMQDEVYGQLAPARRRGLHARAAELLAPSPRGRGSARARALGEVAHHLRRSGAADAALEAFLAAGRAAEELFAHADASDHYERAIELWTAGGEPPPGVSDVDIVERRAEARWLGLGDAAGACESLREALALLGGDDPPRRADLLSRLAGFSWETDAVAGDALALHAEARETVGDADSVVRARVLRRQARALMIAGHTRESAEVAREALELAEATGTVVDQADARITLFCCRTAEGDVAGAREEIERTRMLVRELDAPDTVARFFNNSAMHEYELGAYEEAVRTADEGDAQLERLGLNVDDRLNVVCVGAASLTWLGRLDEAEQRLSVVEPQLPIAVVNVAIERANIARIRGEFSRARTELGRASATGAATKDPPVAAQLAVIRADVAAWDEPHAAAWRYARQGLAVPAAEIPRSVCAWMLSVALRVIADGRAQPPSAAPEDGAGPAQADDLLARLQLLADAAGGSHPVVAAHIAQARGERSRVGAGGDPAAWERAASAWEALGRPYDLAYARIRQAEALVAVGATGSRVSDALDAATDAAEVTSAHALLERITRVRDSMVTDGLSVAGDPSGHPSPDASVAAPPLVTLRREGEYWTVTYAAGAMRLRDTKGMRYLAQLVANPGVEVHATELVSDVGVTTVVARPDGLELADGGGLGPALDAQAKAAYRRRLDDLRADIDEAESFHDIERAARAREEYDFLLAELSRAVGLGGRDRPVRSRAERARVSATKAIKTAIRRLGEQDVELGEDLAAAVRTGTFCTYRPLAGASRWQVLT